MNYKKTSVLVSLLLIFCILPFSGEINGSQITKNLDADEKINCNCEYSGLKEADYPNIIVDPSREHITRPIKIPDQAEPAGCDDSNIDEGSLPATLDWRNRYGKDWTTSIKNQGLCGSCWDFAAIGALESRIKIKNNLPDLDIDLSEQYLLSCANIGGCYGSCAWLAYKYIEQNGGIIPEYCLPYTESDKTPCSISCPDWKEKRIPVLSYGYWFKPSIKFIKNELINRGPLVSSIVKTDDFEGYKGGYVYSHPGDESGQLVTHEIIIVGYDDYRGCWICKNSWGTEWGETKDFKQNDNHMDGGWFRIAYDDCKIGTWVTYVTVEEVSIYHVKILEPRDGLYNNNQKIWNCYPSYIFGNFDVKVEAYNSDSDVKKVEFYLDNVLKKTDDCEPYIWNCDEQVTLSHKIKAKVYSKNGDIISEELNVIIFNLGNENNGGVFLTGYPDDDYKKWNFTGFIPELLYNPDVDDDFWAYLGLKLDYDFDFGDGKTSRIENIQSASQIISHEYINEKGYNAEVKITLKLDVDIGSYYPPVHLHCENKGTGKMTIEVNRDYIPPSAEASGPDKEKTKKSLQFQGVAKGGKSPYHYSWDFDINDGITENCVKQNPTYSYEEKNTYIVTLIVTDDINNKAIDILELEITKETTKSKLFIFTEGILVLMQRFFQNIKPLFFSNLKLQNLS